VSRSQRHPRTAAAGRAEARQAPERPEAGQAQTGGRGSVEIRHGWREALVAFALFCGTLLVFWPTLSNGFVNWDDPNTVVNNTNCHGLDAARIKWMFSTFFWGHYQPLVWLSYAVDYLCSRWLFGDGPKPAVCHLTNNVLHALNAALLYLLALRLLALTCPTETRDARWRPPSDTSPPLPTGQAQSWPFHAAAILASMLFAWHPLRVEPVAWVTGRGDVLVMLFMLLTLLAYLRAIRADRGPHYAAWLLIACLLFVASLLTRAMAVTLPVVMLLLDWYPLRRLRRSPKDSLARSPLRVCLEKTPFVLLAAGAAMIAPLAKATVGATVQLAWHGPVERLAQACYGLVFYIWKTLIPLGLSPIYELRMPIDVHAPRYVVSFLLVLLGMGLLISLLWRHRATGLVCAASAYVILTLPVLGFVQSGNQEVADRYCYLASLPLTVLAAAGALRVWRARQAPRWLKLGLGAAGGAFTAILVVLTWRQCAFWRDAATLWSHAAQISPNSSIALNGHGWILLEQKQYEEAVPCLRRAIELQPANEKAHHNLWRALREQGKSEELFQAYRDSVRAFPPFAEAHYNLGNELLARGQNDEAASEYRATVSLKPGDSKAHANLGKVLRRQGNAAEALQEYELAVRSDPKNVIARHGVALLLYDQGRRAEAIEQLREALRVDSNYEPVKATLDAWMKEPGSSP
jgi:protein O-mannosyl-transferase